MLKVAIMLLSPQKYLFSIETEIYSTVLGKEDCNRGHGLSAAVKLDGSWQAMLLITTFLKLNY